MTCTSCEKTIERTLKKLVGVFNAKANYSEQFVENEASGYGIVKDGKILGIIEVVDDINKSTLEEIRETYIQ